MSGKERPVTVGYLKQLFERLNLSDKAFVYSLSMSPDGLVWDRVGPEGQELIFAEPSDVMKIQDRANEIRHRAELPFRIAVQMAFNEFKQETGQ